MGNVQCHSNTTINGSLRHDILGHPYIEMVKHILATLGLSNIINSLLEVYGAKFGSC